MPRIATILLVSVLWSLLGVGCTSTPSKPQSTTLSNIYPGDLTKVNRVELLDGTTGQRKWLEDSQDIGLWIDGMKGLVLIPEANQEGSVGNIYTIGFYEDEERRLWFSPSSIQGTYYEENARFTEMIQLKFEQEFDKQ